MMTKRIIKCHVPYKDNASDKKTSKDDNKERRLIVYLEDENYIYCYNITTFTERRSRHLSDMKLKIKKRNNPLDFDSIVKLDKIFKIEKLNGIEQYLLPNNDKIRQEDMTEIKRKTKLFERDPRQKVVEVSKEEFMALNDKKKILFTLGHHIHLNSSAWGI